MVAVESKQQERVMQAKTTQQKLIKKEMYSGCGIPVTYSCTAARLV
jgi:hypothetical protein